MSISSDSGPTFSDSDSIYSDNDSYSGMGFTENGSATHLTTGNPCLDFFFHVVPGTSQCRLTDLIEQAWEHDPLTTLKLVCNLRGVRGTGKSDKEGFYLAALWLHSHHPKTLALNAKSFAEFGYLKDLPEVLYRILEGGDVRTTEKQERSIAPVYWVRGKRKVRDGSMDTYRKAQLLAKFEKNPSKSKGEEKAAEKLKRLYINPGIKMPGRKNKEALTRRATERYNTDQNYRLLHDEVSSVFAELLSKDLEFLKLKQHNKISLAAKWCPSLDTSYDRSTLICESIARKVFPRDSHPEYEGIEDSHYAYRVRDSLRKQVLSPLRQVLELPEVYMSANKWDSLPYERVASVAMKTYTQLFAEHDSDRFNDYLEKVKKGEKKIAAGALLPHEIMASLDEGEQDREVAELQWKRMVGDLSAKGTLNNCIAVCDVSGSMSGLPMEVCVALGILVSELSQDPWKGQLITFSANPTLETLQGDTLEEKKAFVEHMEWGMNTNFRRVFDLILDVAVKGKLLESQLIKKIFVFSDMEFDQASARPWETDYKAIQRKFDESGYGSAIPEIVFWNLRDSRATPVKAKQNGVALVSGYSKNLMKLFLDGKGPMNPEVIMEEAISGEEYKNLKVYD